MSSPSGQRVELSDSFELSDLSKGTTGECPSNVLTPDMTVSSFNSIFDKISQLVSNDNLPKIEVTDKNSELIKTRYGMLDGEQFRQAWRDSIDNVNGDSIWSAIEYQWDRLFGGRTPEQRFREATDRVDELFHRDLGKLTNDAKSGSDPAVRKDARDLLRFIDRTEGLQLPQRWRHGSLQQIRDTLRQMDETGK